MSSLSTSTPMRRALLALAVAALAAMAFATSASAAPATGEVTLTLKKGAQSSLLRQGVKVTPSSGGGKVRTVKLAVTDLDLASGAIKTGAALTFRANGKSVKLNDLLVSVGATSTAVTGKHGGKEKVIFRLKGNSRASASSLGVSGPLSLTGTGLQVLRRGLELPSLKGGKVGSAAASAALPPAPPAPPKPEEKPQGEPYPYATQCPVGPVSGGPGGAGTTPGTVSGIAAAPTFGAGTEQSVSGTELDWGFKSGFREYVLGSPPPGTLQPLDGAEAVGADMEDAASYFKFPTSGGSYERGTENDHSDDKLVVNGTGTVLFCKSGHGFNVVLKNPTVTIDGGESRITADLGSNFNGVWYPFQRVDVAELEIDATEPTVSDGGNTVAWDEIPAKLTADGSKASGLSGFYKAGAALDPITVKTTLNRPLRTQCSVAEGTGTPPALTPALAPLPVLNSPVTGSGGTINWGLRRATRASVAGAPGGSFQMLGGAAEGYPGNMGGGEEAAPTGGQGKFFRFPISSYEYEQREVANLTDDRLIATSEASVGFCNPGGGNYGLILSKPTLVIDGLESRLIANAYSFSGGTPNPNAAGWLGGRVEIVDLDPSAVNAVAAGNKVTWGEVTADNTPLLSGIPVVDGFQTNALTYAFLSLGGGTTAGGFDKVAAQIELLP